MGALGKGGNLRLGGGISNAVCGDAVDRRTNYPVATTHAGTRSPGDPVNGSELRRPES